MLYNGLLVKREKTMSILEKIKDSGIPTNTPGAAIQYMRDYGLMELPTEEYRERITVLTNIDAHTSDEDELNFLYRYIIAGAIDGETNMERLVQSALEKSKTFIANNEFVFARPEENQAPKLDAAGNVKPKKGAKKDLAIKVYNEQIKDKGLSRKEAIQIIMDEVKMSSGGASTYYANLKSGRMR